MLVLISSMFQYGFGLKIAEDYQPLFISLLQTVISDKQSVNTDVLAMLLRTLISMGRSFHAKVSSVEFTLKAYVAQLLDTDNSELLRDLDICSATFDLITLYSMLYPDQVNGSFIDIIYAHPTLGRLCCQSNVAEDSLNRLLSSRKRQEKIYRLPAYLEPYTVGISGQAESVEQCKRIIQDSNSYHFLAAYIRLCAHIASRDSSKRWNILLAQTILDGGILHRILSSGIENGASGIFYGLERGDWMRCQTSGWTSFLYAWIHAVGGDTPLRRDGLMNVRLAKDIYAVAMAAVMDGLPGEESIMYRILHTCVLGRSWVQECLDINQDAEDNGAWGFLKDYFDMNMWSTRTLIQSRLLHGVQEASSPYSYNETEEETRPELESLSSSNSDIVGAPLPWSWIYSPLQIIVDEQLASGPEVAPPTDISDSQLVSPLLELIFEVETQIKGGYSSNPGLVARMPMLLKNTVEENQACTVASHLYVLMGLYLLDSDVYLDARVGDIVCKLLDKHLGKSLSNSTPAFARQIAFMIEQVAGGQIQFFNMYRELVSRYAANSFGDESFSRLLVIPLMQGFEYALSCC